MPSLTYKNVPLIFDWQQAVAQFMDKNQRIEDLLEFPEATSRYTWQTNPVRPKNRIGLPRYNWPDPPPLRVNQLYWPCTGATRWAFGLFLATTESKDALLAKNCSEYGYLMAYTGDNPPEGAINSNSEHYVTSALYMLTPRRLAGCTTSDELWLIPLVDQRYFWQFRSVGDIWSIMITKDSNCQEVCELSWTTLLTYLLSKTGTPKLEIDSIPYTTSPDCREFRRPYDNLACVLDAAAASVGCQVVATGDGTIRIERPEVAVVKMLANLRATPDQVAGSDCAKIARTDYARYVEVAYPILRNYRLDCDDYEYADSAKTNASCGLPATVKTYHVPGVFVDMGVECTSMTPTNLAQFNALTSQIALDYDAWSRYQYDVTYATPRQWACNGYDDHVLYKYGIEEPDHYETVSEADPQSHAGDPLLWSLLKRHDRRVHQTRVQSLPANIGVDSQLHSFDQPVLREDTVRFELTEELCAGDTASAMVLGSCCDQTLGDTGISILVEDTAEIICGDKFYGISTATDSDGKCVITSSCGCVPAGSRGTARYYPDACRWELVSIEVCDENQNWFVEATECIKPGDDDASGDLYKRGANGELELVCEDVSVNNEDCLVLALKGERFRVEPPACQGDDSWRPFGTFGLVRQVRVSQCIECKKTGNATVLQSTCAESASGDCLATMVEGGDNCSITICNNTGRPLAPCGDEDMIAFLTPGVFDPNTTRKDCCWFVSAMPFPIRAYATLSQKLCPTDSTAFIDGFNFLTVFDGTAGGEQATWTKPQSAYNRYGLAGCAGQYVELQLRFFGCSCQWDIVQVQPKTKDVLADVKLTCESDTCKIEKRVFKDSLVWSCDDSVCGETETWQTVATGQTVYAMYDLTLACEGTGSDCTGKGLNKSWTKFCAFCVDSSYPDEVLAFSKMTVTKAVKVAEGSECSDCKIRYETVDICGLWCETETADKVAFTANSVDIPTNLDLQCDGLHFDTVKAFVLCKCAGESGVAEGSVVGEIVSADSCLTISKDTETCKTTITNNMKVVGGDGISVSKSGCTYSVSLNEGQSDPKITLSVLCGVEISPITIECVETSGGWTFQTSGGEVTQKFSNITLPASVVSVTGDCGSSGSSGSTGGDPVYNCEDCPSCDLGGRRIMESSTGTCTCIPVGDLLPAGWVECDTTPPTDPPTGGSGISFNGIVCGETNSYVSYTFLGMPAGATKYKITVTGDKGSTATIGPSYDHEEIPGQEYWGALKDGWGNPPADECFAFHVEFLDDAGNVIASQEWSGCCNQ